MSERRLERLEEARRLRPSRGRAERAIAALSVDRLADAKSLVRAHEALLFLRAYPQTAAVLRAALRGLARLARRVTALHSSGVDLSALDEDPEVSGMAGSRVTTRFTYDLVRWLADRFPGKVEIDWEDYEGADLLGSIGSRWLPLLEEEASADANVPYLRWLAAGGAGARPLVWLLERFGRLPLAEKRKAELFDALGLNVRWRPAPRVSRTFLSGPVRRIVFQDQPLLARRDVSLARELAGPPLPIRRLPQREGTRILDMARAADGSRYRELYGFTYGDPSRVLAARAGRGVEIFLNGLPPERRLPLRAGYSAFVLKNGVPVAYVEGLAFFERIEVGFNVYYTYREGESAWIYAKVLQLFHQALGSASFSADPFQLGHENEEGIESGAFWFYRKLGFRSTSPRLRALTRAEEARLAARPSHRTTAATLRELATHNALYELVRREAGGGRRNASLWDRFHIRNVGLAVNRRMAREFGGDAARVRVSSLARVSRALGISAHSWRESERRAFQNLALVLDLIPDLPRWSRKEKEDVAAVIRAKGGPDESVYLRRMQRHARLRRALIQLGSGTRPWREPEVSIKY